MDQVKTVKKWIEKIKTPRKKRSVQVKNRTFPLFSSSKKRKTKSRINSKAFDSQQPRNLLYDFDDALFNTKRQEKTTDNGVDDKKSLKKALKEFLSPSKNKSTSIKNKWIKHFKKNSKSSQTDKKIGQVVSVSRSSLMASGAFSASSPVFNRKTFDEKTKDLSAINLNHKQIIYLDNKNIETYCGFISEIQVNDDDDDDDDEYDSGKESPTTLTPIDLIRSSSDSEILPMIDTKESEEEFYEFSRDSIFRHSYPGTRNSTKRDSNRKFMRCILENMAKYVFDNNQTKISDEESFDLENENYFESFDEIIIPNSPLQPKKSMRETLLEISSRRNQSSNMEMIYSPMKSPKKIIKNGSWKLNQLSTISNVIFPNDLGIPAMNISEKDEEEYEKDKEENDKYKKKCSKEIIHDDNLNNYDNQHSDGTPRRRACFEDSYSLNNSDHSYDISMYV